MLGCMPEVEVLEEGELGAGVADSASMRGGRLGRADELTPQFVLTGRKVEWEPRRAERCCFYRPF